MKRAFCAALIGFALTAGNAAAGAGLGPVIARYGNWEVHRLVDKMTDKVECIASYKGDPRIQLSNVNLLIKVNGTPQNYQYRVDNEESSRLLEVSGVSKKSGIIGFGGDAFNRLLRSQRLRGRVSVVRFPQKFEVLEFDLELDGIYNAYSAVYYCR